MNRFYLRVLYGISFVVFFCGFLLACGGQEANCAQCKAGERHCSPDGTGVAACKKLKSTGCYQLVIERCRSGEVCSKQDGRAACGVPAACQVTCQPGSTRCNGQAVENCVKNTATGCSQWFPDKTCPADSPCENGACKQKPQGCQSKNPQQEKRCVGDTVYWFDDCGKQGNLVEKCPPTHECKTNQCVKKQPQGCQPKNPQKEKRCVGSSVYWFDDCGKQVSKVEDCTPPKKCENGQCKGPQGCQTTNTQHEKRCVGDVVYWFDNCGKQGNYVTQCHSPQKCQGGKCVGSTCQNQCSANASRCVGASVQNCDRNPQTGCYSWGNPIQCSAGNSCQNGVCVQGGGGNPGGRQCKTSSFIGTCKNDNECCANQKCTSVLVYKGCGPCRSDADCPKAGITRTKCCKVLGKTLCALTCPF